MLDNINKEGDMQENKDNRHERMRFSSCPLCGGEERPADCKHIYSILGQNIDKMNLDGQEKSDKQCEKAEFISLLKYRENSFDDKTNYFTKKRISLYKTEMCRSFEETGYCKYAERCQFAHKADELRFIDRHPRYKTETCRTFWEIGTCPYGKRCCFIHMEKTSADEESTAETKLKQMQETDISSSDSSETELFSDSMQDHELTSNYCNRGILNVKLDTDSDDSLLGEIQFNYSDSKNLSLENIVKKLFIENEYETVEKNEIQQLRPFWHTNAALIWVPSNMAFCYISKHNYKHHRVTNQPKAPGEPMASKTDSEIAEFVLDKLGL